MADFVVRVELRGKHPDADEYRRLHAVMANHGFYRNVSKSSESPASSALNAVLYGQKPTANIYSSLLLGLATQHAMPHATYFGSNFNSATNLKATLVAAIRQIHWDIVLFVAEVKDYDIHP